MYKYLSACYDLFMSDVDYDAWVRKIVRCLGRRKKGIDCGCGSGKITAGLKKAGYDVTGADISVEMLNVAAANFRKENLDIPLVKMDSEKLAVAGKADFITAACDVVNYMKHPERFFARSYDALTDDGILVFDISSRYKLVEIIGNNVFTDSADDVTYIWANHLSAKKDKVEMFLTFFTRNADGSYAKREENQVQYVYDAEYLAELLRGAGFADVSYDYFDGKITPETEERIFFTAYKGGIK